MKDVTYSGIGSVENNLLVRKMNLETDLAYYPNIFKLNSDDFLAKSDSVTKLFKVLSDEYKKLNNIDCTFIKTFDAEIKYEQPAGFLHYLFLSIRKLK